MTFWSLDQLKQRITDLEKEAKELETLREDNKVAREFRHMILWRVFD